MEENISEKDGSETRLWTLNYNCYSPAEHCTLTLKPLLAYNPTIPDINITICLLKRGQ